MLIASPFLALGALVATTLLDNSHAESVTAISDCPALTARNGPANASDLRPDDIKVIGALGDSIMAGFAMEGMNPDGTGLLNISSIDEFRGQSYGAGGDAGAVTLPNFVNHYNSSLKGASLGRHLVEFCQSDICLDFFRFPKKDVLNSALSGAIAQNLDAEIDFLIHQMKSLPGVDYQNDWKMISIQIGSNDQCASCLTPWSSQVTAEKYGQYVEAAIQRIQNEIPRTLVNLLGVFKVSPVYYLTKNQSDYCHPLLNQDQLQFNRVECSCFFENENGLTKMDTLVDSYNSKLDAIYRKYQSQNNESFALAYQPANVDVSTFPVDVLRYVEQVRRV
ncbi:hypothetical protein BCR43DRAFT_433121 [Syncephalastrum racemosum]|uniref:SGNH hydrolase-type esterase domain-containing protein n=1 Tax=Syncephalastrum racemosum TaxID=13706 RepID=A0A1X2HLZ3_SYNRA|nr:hypothetical protein BCR43DRAFT_433121 [Syncephalastrum racemosum]